MLPLRWLRQLPLCGLAAWKHLALQAVSVQQVYDNFTKIQLYLSGWIKYNEVNDRLEFGDIVYEKENTMSCSNCDCIFNLLYRIFQASITFRCCRG